jgi:hypothetical protein
MKIKTIEKTTNKPLTNTKIQIQVKGKDSGYLSTTTDTSGSFELDDKYSDQQIAAINSGTPGQYVTASNNATLTVTATQNSTNTTKQTTTTNNK